MSDHLHGSEPYYLEGIRDNTDAIVPHLEQVDGKLLSIVERLGTLNDNIGRLLDGMRELLNIENECATFVREVTKQRDTAGRVARERDLTEMFTTMFLASGNIDHFNEYLSTKDEYILSKIEAAMIRINAYVMKEVQEREKSKQNTARLIHEDSKQW